MLFLAANITKDSCAMYNKIIILGTFYKVFHNRTFPDSFFTDSIFTSFDSLYCFSYFLYLRLQWLVYLNLPLLLDYKLQRARQWLTSVRLPVPSWHDALNEVTAYSMSID